MHANTIPNTVTNPPPGPHAKSPGFSCEVGLRQVAAEITKVIDHAMATYKTVASWFGVDESTISKWTSGRSLPSLETVLNAKRLGRMPGWFGRLLPTFETETLTSPLETKYADPNNNGIPCDQDPADIPLIVVNASAADAALHRAMVNAASDGTWDEADRGTVAPYEVEAEQWGAAKRMALGQA
jgi:hypothetical protein